jgi:hypothetical protein
MSSALFSRAYVTDPAALMAGAQAGEGRGGRSGRRKGNKPRPVFPNQERFVRALSSSFEKVLRRVLPVQGKVDERTFAKAASVLAEQTADIVAGRSVILQLNQELDGASRRAVEAFLQSVINATQKLESARQEAAIAKLAEVMLPDPLAEARGPIALDNLELRDRFVAEVPVLTSADVGSQSGHGSRSNPYATAARWKRAGRIFSINHRGADYFPAFQFRDGRPHPTIAEALKRLPRTMTPWQIAFWFVSANGWLSGEAPRNRLDEADSIIAAAEREGEEVMG